MADRVINFGPGPSSLPLPVLEAACKGLINFNGTGIGIAELSHRSKDFADYIANVEHLIRTQLKVPSSHRIIFTQGGGLTQFSAVALNLLARHYLLYPDLKREQRVMDYVLTGSWSRKASDEAKRLGCAVNVVADSRTFSESGSFDNIPPHGSYQFSKDPALIYYCENETVDGVQFSHDDTQPSSFPYHSLPPDPNLPLVADYSSSFMSRLIPHLEKHAVIYAGAQKNMGPAGLTIVIVREDCIVDVDAAAKLGAIPVPLMMSYKTLATSGSLHNTPPMLSIYITGLVLERMKELGGVEYYEKVNRRKAEKLYTEIKKGEEKGVLKLKVKEGSGSWMNVVFDTVGEGTQSKFLEEAAKRGMVGLKGHRSVGGLRASLYNAITEEQTDTLIAFLRDFITQR